MMFSSLLLVRIAGSQLYCITNSGEKLSCKRRISIRFTTTCLALQYVFTVSSGIANALRDRNIDA